MELDYEKIELYLQNIDIAYEAWYKSNLLKETGMEDEEFTGSILPIEKIKIKFEKWFEDNQNFLTIKICVEWKFLEKKEIFNTRIALISALANYMFDFADFPMEVAPIIINEYCDKLCQK